MSPIESQKLVWRDRLYELMARCLKEPELAALFDHLGEQAFRYRVTLKEWSAMPHPDDPLAQALAFSELLFNHGLFFATHEYLEAFWKSAEGGTKTGLQGLIQIAAGFHKLELDPTASAGALELLEKGLKNLEEARPAFGEDVSLAMRKKLEPALAQLSAGRPAAAKAPRLFWA